MDQPIIDPKYECDAPLYVDFAKIREFGDMDDGADKWFDTQAELEPSPDNCELNEIEVKANEPTSPDNCELKDTEVKVENQTSPVKLGVVTPLANRCAQEEPTKMVLRSAKQRKSLKVKTPLHAPKYHKEDEEYVPLAVQLQKFYGTPPRYRTRARQAMGAAAFDTVDELPKGYQFKATKLNPAIFARCGQLGVPPRNSKPLTVPVSPALTSSTTVAASARHDSNDGGNSDNVELHTNPVPKAAQSKAKKSSRVREPLHIPKHHKEDPAYISSAEQLLKFCATPPRFHTKAKPAMIPAAESADEPTKSHHFKATKLNPAIFTQHGLLGVPPRNVKPITVPVSPALTSAAESCYCGDDEDDSENTDFDANSVAKATGVPQKRGLQHMEAMLPNPAMKKRKISGEQKKGKRKSLQRRSKLGEVQSNKRTPVILTGRQSRK